MNKHEAHEIRKYLDQIEDTVANGDIKKKALLRQFNNRAYNFIITYINHRYENGVGNCYQFADFVTEELYGNGDGSE